MAANDPDGRLSAYRIVLICLNVFCFLAGLAMLGGTLYLYIDKSDLLTFVYLMNAARPACILVMTAACITIAVSILGGLGAGMLNKQYLFAYSAILILAGLAAGAGLGCAVTGKVKYTDYIRWQMRDVLLKQYGTNLTNPRNAFLTKKWDEAQRKWYCCATDNDSWGVYRSSAWFELQEGNREIDRPLVPKSCCTYDQYGNLINLQKCRTWADGPPRKTGGPRNEALLYRGCYTYGTELLQHVSKALIAISIILILIFIGCLAVSVLIILSLTVKESKQAVIRQTAYNVTKKNPTFDQGNYDSYKGPI